MLLGFERALDRVQPRGVCGRAPAAWRNAQDPGSAADPSVPTLARGLHVNEGAQFDFWLGDWNVTWPDGRGTNRVRKVLDGKVILEEFDGKPDIDLEGMSVSTYDAEQRRWLQTWVDSRGN
jgi:hypothetical protein